MRMAWTPGVLLVMAGCAAEAPPPAPVATPLTCSQTGEASWYGGKPSPHDLVAAHRTLPFGTVVHVTALDSERSVTVRITDRGPFAKGRIIDLSEAAAQRLGMRHGGVTQVRLEIDGPASDACPLQEAALTAG